MVQRVQMVQLAHVLHEAHLVQHFQLVQMDLVAQHLLGCQKVQEVQASLEYKYATCNVSGFNEPEAKPLNHAKDNRLDLGLVSRIAS